MKRCNSCSQILSQKIITCPACGSKAMDGIRQIDGYTIKTIIHEGHSTMVCKAVPENSDTPVSIRIFTRQSGVDNRVAQRLKNELILLQELPSEHFVQHFSLKKSQEGLWYRISEWVDAASWGEIFISGLLNDQHRTVKLFLNIASVLNMLHKKDHFMPYLILDDILIPKKRKADLHVKINYKLSRFLNARATHHGPMLQKLLDCHPDIANQRAVDFKTAIWSLGKVFVEIMTANPNITNFSDNVDSIKGIDPELAILIKIMLSDDPDLRPQSMQKVVLALSKIQDRLLTETNALPPKRKEQGILNEVTRLKKTIILLVMLVVGLAAVLGTFSFLYFDRKDFKGPAELLELVDKYSSSVGFLLVEYWLKSNEKIFYKSSVEGTAFLVDKNGYLLTNRHVACPWLEDPSLFKAAARHAASDQNIHFGYRMYLWFEGEKAFTRLPGLRNSRDISDSYYLSTAYSSEGKGNLRIVGVPRSPMTTGERIKSPFKNDFAVLKIDQSPADLTPLPLETIVKPEDIQRLSPIIILGFPLGNQTQDQQVNTSITRGHVRRTSKAIIQVDSSIYKGNSGGPVFNNKGRVIGIASGVVTERGGGYFNSRTPLSDFGLILPIEIPAQFLETLKVGQPHWEGFLDFSLGSKLEQITELALDNRFEQALELTREMIQKSTDPLLLYTAGMLSFCSENFNDARSYLEKLTIIEPENTSARLVLYIVNWLNDGPVSPETTSLFSMKWYDSNEFSGYLAHVLKSNQQYEPGYLDYENRAEKSWRLFIEALILEKKNQLEQATEMLKTSILNSAGNDWIYFLSFSRLNRLQAAVASDSQGDLTSTDKTHTLFKKTALKHRHTAEENRTALAALIHNFESEQTDHKKKVTIYQRLIQMSPENRTITGRVAFYHATQGEWQKALTFIDRYFETPGRETSLSLSLGLLKGQILLMMGKKHDALLFLNDFSNNIQSSWYRIIIRHLTQDSSDKDIVQLAGRKPEKLITIYTALGLWAEGTDDRQKALYYYREALSSYLDGWNEYSLSLGRFIHLRQSGV